MSLNLEFHEPGYLFGCLFAVLERVQSLANPGANSTIVDRFYGSPRRVPEPYFRNCCASVRRTLEGPPIAIPADRKLTGEIMDGLLPRFEPTLDLPEQGLFSSFIPPAETFSVRPKRRSLARNGAPNSRRKEPTDEPPYFRRERHNATRQTL